MSIFEEYGAFNIINQDENVNISWAYVKKNK